MYLTIQECSEATLGEATRFVRRCFLKQEAPLLSRQERDDFLRLLSDKALYRRIAQGEIRLICALDNDRIVACALLENTCLLVFCTETRYRRSDAPAFLLDFILFFYLS